MSLLVEPTAGVEGRADAAVAARPARGVQAGAKPAKAPASLFRTVWRWHFYAGVFVAPVLLVMASTGALYIFRAEVDEFVHRGRVFVADRAERVSYQAQVDAAVRAHPGSTPTSIRVHPDPTRSTVVGLKPAGAKAETGGRAGGKGGPRGVEVYVDPHDGRVLGSASGEDRLASFFRVILTIHRSLWAGTTGRVITELATCWSIVLFITGVYLWWPKGKKPKAAGVWTVRLKAKLYTALRDIHALGGIYLLPVAGTILVTGLFYTVGVGTVIHQGAAAWVGDHDDHGAAATKPAKPGAMASREDRAEPAAPAAVPSLPLDDLIGVVQARYPGRIVSATLGAGGMGRRNAAPTSPHEIKLGAGNDFNRTYGKMVNTEITLQRATGKVVAEKGNDQTAFFWHAWTYPLHVGSVGGFATKVLWLLACLTLMMLPVTGLWMWWERRPKGRSGLPRRPDVRLPAALIAGIGLLGLVLPVMGASILLLLAGEAAWTFAARFRRPAPALA